MLPAATAVTPDASSMSAVRVVTVVLPLVPVIATTGRFPTCRQAYSTSLHTGTPPSRVSTTGRERSENPGLAKIDSLQQPCLRL